MDGSLVYNNAYVSHIMQAQNVYTDTCKLKFQKANFLPPIIDLEETTPAWHQLTQTYVNHYISSSNLLSCGY